MHATAGRRQDQLRFALQEALAPVLCPNVKVAEGDIRPAVHPAVEALMHQFHAHAKVIRRETERLLQRAAVRTTTAASRRRCGCAAPTVTIPRFVLRDGAIELKDDGIFFQKPSEMVRLFSAAIELDVPLALRTREMVVGGQRRV